MPGPHTTTRPQPYPWPWGQPSILITNKEEERRRANYWLDAKLESDTESSSSGSNDSADSEGIPELSWRQSARCKIRLARGLDQPTPSEKEFDQKEDQARQLDAVAVYNPDLFVSLVTQLYELLIDMEELGYDAAVISMQRLPKARPYPYQYLDGCPDLDAWMLPLTLPNRDGWHIMLDTRLGVVRAYCADAFIPDFETAEFRRQGVVADFDEWEMCGRWTEYRRAPLVPAAVYFSEIIDAYRSLKRLPMVEPYLSDPNEPHPAPEERRRGREEKMTLLNLYRECGWPDQWQRAEFVAKWEASKEEIRARFDTARLKDESRHRVNAPSYW
ncbi:hypothetical protein C8R43DRAFT_1052591 [Mycena crocata]|nr:hypothetical protein C8R43DRAFT_1052591 [Mycena crocata]